MDAAKKNVSTNRLKLLLTVVERKKAEFYADLLQGFRVNMQLIAYGEGTAAAETLEMLGLSDRARAVIFSVIREDQVPAAMETLEEKFRTIRGGKGVAFSVPMDSVIGATVFRFLGDSRGTL